MTTNLKKPSTRTVKKTPKAKDKSLVEEAIKEQMSVGVRELRQDASKVLALVKSGESVIVTEWGKPVAEIRPIKNTTLQDLIDAGIITPAKNKFNPKIFNPAPNTDGRSLVAILLKDREEARY